MSPNFSTFFKVLNKGFAIVCFNFLSFQNLQKPLSVNKYYLHTQYYIIPFLLYVWRYRGIHEMGSGDFVSAVSYTIHTLYLIIPLHTNSWNYISRTLFVNSPVYSYSYEKKDKMIYIFNKLCAAFNNDQGRIWEGFKLP